MTCLSPDQLGDWLFESIVFDRHCILADHICTIKLHRVGPTKISAAVRDYPHEKSGTSQYRVAENNQLVLRGRVFVPGRNGFIPQFDTPVIILSTLIG